MIDPEFKAKWVKALRSGRYKQGTGKLRKRKDGKLQYCCLGVACNLIDNKRWKPLLDNFNFGSIMSGQGPTEFSYNNLISGLRPSEVSILMNLNDTDQSFNDIADWIEANL